MTTQIKIGAKVTLAGTVEATHAHDSYLVRLTTYNALWFLRSAFLTIENPPEPLKIGDKVKCIHSDVHWIIIGIARARAWLWCEFKDDFRSARLSECERIPA